MAVSHAVVEFAGVAGSLTVTEPDAVNVTDLEMLSWPTYVPAHTWMVAPDQRRRRRLGCCCSPDGCRPCPAPEPGLPHWKPKVRWGRPLQPRPEWTPGRR